MLTKNFDSIRDLSFLLLIASASLLILSAQDIECLLASL